MSWLTSLKVGDKLDIFDDKLNNIERRRWHIGTIIAIKETSISVHFDGWSSKFDEWINDNDVSSNKLQPLHTHTPYHDNKLEACKSSSKRYPCTKCQRICCGKCFIVSTYRSNKLEYQCKECVSLSQYQYLFSLIKLIYESIFRENMMEINIITLITNYSLENFIKCDNKIKDCSNMIDVKFEKQMLKIINMEYNQNDLINNQRLIICKTCCWDKQNYSGKCKVFHDEMENCDICHTEICTKCIQNCKGSRCKNNYCNQCWTSMASNKCINCDTYLCNDCHNGVNGPSICSKCSDQICIKCKLKCYATGCIQVLCKYCRCVVCKRYGCNDCCGEMRKCHECGREICNGCFAEKCICCHNEFCLQCKPENKCASIYCKNIVCDKCKDTKDIKWDICDGCQYYYGKKLNLGDMKFLFCNQCTSAFNKCTECTKVYCKSCFTKDQFQCIGCKSANK